MKALFTVSLTAFAIYFNAVAVPLYILTVMMVVDYVTGMVSAWIKRELSSRKGLIGIIRKVCYLALIAAAMGADWLIYNGMSQIGVSMTDYTVPLGITVTVWLIVNELISILENVGKIGVPLPLFLIRIINRLKSIVDESEDK